MNFDRHEHARAILPVCESKFDQAAKHLETMREQIGLLATHGVLKCGDQFGYVDTFDLCQATANFCAMYMTLAEQRRLADGLDEGGGS